MELLKKWDLDPNNFKEPDILLGRTDVDCSFTISACRI